MYIAYLVEEGEGCDYTIACGETVLKLKATTRDEAIKELRQEIIGEWNGDEYEGGYGPDQRLEHVEFFEVVDKELMPISVWYSDADAFRKKQANGMAEESEKAEYDRLKIKFGG